MAEQFDEQKIVFKNGSVGQTMQFPSANPRNYHHAMSEPSNLPSVMLDGKLFLPPNHQGGSLATVIIVPGSVGIAVSHLAHAETITNLGAAAFVIDPFGPRKVSSTVANQTQFSFAASAYDVLAAVQFVSSLPNMDTNRIGAQGHSRGGSAVISASMQPFSQPIVGEGPKLRAVYAAYPWCGHQFTTPDIGQTVLRTVIGERDNWCSPQQTQGYMHAIRLAGGDASFQLYADAEHSFDRQPPVETTPNAAVAPNAPTIYLDQHGAMIHPVTGVANAKVTDRDMMIYGLKAGFGVTGATLGGKADQPAAFTADMSAFWRQHLELN